MPGEDVDLDRLAAIAEEAARAGAEVLTGSFDVSIKSGHNDVVTEHDIAAEQEITAVLTARTPKARVLGEEGASYDGGGALTWHVDPIDGTSNYASGAPLFCISIGASLAGRPVAGVIYDPSRDEIFATTSAGVLVNGAPIAPSRPGSAEEAVLLTNFPYEGAWFRSEDLRAYESVLRGFRGVRRLGSSALALAYVAAGRAAACGELRTKPWDHAAGAALVLAAGGDFVGIDADGVRTDDVQQVERYVAAGSGFSIEGSVLEQFVAEG